MELSEMARVLTEHEVYQTKLRKGRSNEGVYYYVHWAKMQAHLQAQPYDEAMLHLQRVDKAIVEAWCRKQQNVVQIRSFVASGPKRLGCIKDCTTLKYLGAASFDAAIQHIEVKMQKYNTQHPHDTQVTFDTVQLDHIKPVQSFALDMNHYTNLQPMLAQANLSKSCKWSSADESFWKTNIHRYAGFTEMYDPADTLPQTLNIHKGGLQKRNPAAFAVRKQECRSQIARQRL